MTRQPIYSNLGTRIGYTETHKFQGIVQADTYSELNTKIKEIERVYSFNGRNAGLYLTNGSTRTHIFLDSATCMGGTRVTAMPSFPVGTGAELSTYRTYDIEIQGDVVTEGGNPLMNYEESFDYVGTGGPEFVYHVPLKGRPIRHQVTEASLRTITQKGSAVGLRAYPTVPLPAFPGDEVLPRRQISRRQPRIRAGQNWEYPVSWSYTFQLP